MNDVSVIILNAPIFQQRKPCRFYLFHVVEKQPYPAPSSNGFASRLSAKVPRSLSNIFLISSSTVVQSATKSLFWVWLLGIIILTTVSQLLSTMMHGPFYLSTTLNTIVPSGNILLLHGDLYVWILGISSISSSFIFAFILYYI